MMADSTSTFIDKAVNPHKEKFEKKDYALTERCMVEAG